MARQIRDLMNTEIQTVTPDASIIDVAKMMREGDFGVVPVCQGSSKIVGMVTDRDIVVRAVADGKDIDFVRVADVMTKDVLYCKETDDVEDVADMMSERQVRRVVVLDDRGQLCGIVSLGDLAQMDQTKASRALGDISEPQHNEPKH